MDDVQVFCWQPDVQVLCWQMIEVKEKLGPVQGPMDE